MFYLFRKKNLTTQIFYNYNFNQDFHPVFLLKKWTINELQFHLH